MRRRTSRSTSSLRPSTRSEHFVFFFRAKRREQGNTWSQRQRRFFFFFCSLLLASQTCTVVGAPPLVLNAQPVLASRQGEDLRWCLTVNPERKKRKSALYSRTKHAQEFCRGVSELVRRRDTVKGWRFCFSLLRWPVSACVAHSVVRRTTLQSSSVCFRTVKERQGTAGAVGEGMGKAVVQVRATRAASAQVRLSTRRILCGPPRPQRDATRFLCY